MLYFFLDSYYETCTRETSDPGSKHYLHWCPSADYLDQTSLEWIGDHSDYSSFGYCTEAYIPKSDICPDHYHEVRQLIDNLHNLLYYFDIILLPAGIWKMYQSISFSKELL